MTDTPSSTSAPSPDSTRQHPLRPGAAALAALSLGAWLLFGCASSTPPPRFHTLLSAPEAGTVPPSPASPGWEVLTVTVPPQVDRPQWVVRQADDALVVLEDERWAAPLADEIGAAVADRLRRAAPATSLAAGRRPWRIAIDVQRFDSAPGRVVRLEAEWSLRPGDATAAGWRCRGAFDRPAGPNYASLAAAHRDLAAQLGDAIARGLAVGLAGATAPVCAP